MARRHSRGEAEMDARLEQLPPDSPRYRVLSAARSFKACWVSLGEQLTVVREDGAFRKWGFASFEAYCRRELRIKQDTANKLTRSFAFLRDHEPDRLAQQGADEAGELPPLDVVDLLSRAKDRTKLTDEALHHLREEVFAPDARPTRQDVLKKLREQDPEAFKAPPKVQDTAPDTELRKALLLAERLESLLQAQGEAISAETVRSAHNVVTELRERFMAQRRQGAA